MLSQMSVAADVSPRLRISAVKAPLALHIDMS